VFFAACVATICLILPAAAIWMGLEALDRTPLPSTDW
jgi:hypothetical protein